MTRLEVSKLVAALIGAFPAARVTDATPAVYETALRDLEHRHAQLAVNRLLATAKFMPTIAEIREAAVEIAHPELRSGAEAWGDVVKAVSKFGINRTPTFDDRLVAAAVEAIGWTNICNAKQDDPSTRAKFADAYNAAARRARTDAALSRGATAPMLERGIEPRALPSGETDRDPDSDSGDGDDD